METEVASKARRKQISLWGLASAALFVVVISTLAGFGGRWWWALDVADTMRPQYAVAGAVAALVFALGRRKALFAVAMLLVLVNGWQVAPAYFGGDEVKAGGSTLRLLAANVHSDNREYGKVLELVKRERPDVVILEEINRAWVEAMEPLRREYPHYIEFPSIDNFGIALYSRRPVKEQPGILYLGEVRAASVRATVEVDGQSVQVLGTHPLPPVGGTYWRWRNDQLDKVAEYVRGLKGHVIVIGDLNMAPWSHYFGRFVNQSGLKDSRRGFGLQCTWPAHCVPLVVPIDHCLVSQELSVRSRKVAEAVGSDHWPVVVEVGIPTR